MKYEEAIKQLETMKPISEHQIEDHKLKLYSKGQVMILLDVILNPEKYVDKEKIV